MFDSEFFPTPFDVIMQMGLNPKNRIILEPSAGKGDIVDFCKTNKAKEVIAFEKSKDLRSILEKKCRVLGEDFLQCRAEDISHVQSIYMNPPFSVADKHIKHAWEIAPEGCEIIALCNYQTLENTYSYDRKSLNSLIKNYGTSENLGDCFSTAERKTGVEIGLVKLFKPIVSSSFNFDGFFEDEDEEERQENGLIENNEVRRLVSIYVATMKAFDRAEAEIENINTIIGYLGLSKVELNYSSNERLTTKEEMSKFMQKRAWAYLFRKINMEKYVTSGVMRDINKHIEVQTKYPFSMKNIYRMLEIISGTREETFKRALVEAIDKFTEHTHENRFCVEGWKTNSGYMLNEKFISGWISEHNYSRGLGIKDYNSNFEKILDLTKVLCNLTGTNYNSIHSIKYSPCTIKDGGYLTNNGYIVKSYTATGYNDNILNFNQFEPNTWYSWGFFEFKVFKKGTGHFKFKDKKHWELLNRAYAKAKGQILPEKL